MLEFLTAEEADALIAAPDRTRWTGRRDHALLVLAVQTGLRISELRALTYTDMRLGAAANVTCTGKGRRKRATPLTSITTAVITGYLAERPPGPATPCSAGHVVSNSHATRLSTASRSTPLLPRRSARAWATST